MGVKQCVLFSPSTSSSPNLSVWLFHSPLLSPEWSPLPCTTCHMGAGPNGTGLHKKLQEEAKTWAHTPMFIAALFTRVKRQQQPKCPSTEEWINTVWHIQMMEYYSALKTKEILTHETTWTNLEGTVLSKISQAQKKKYCMIPLT